MDLGVLRESPQGSQSSSRVGACMCAFLPSCSSSVTLPFAWIKGSGAFTRGFPTGMSHVPPWCESILGLKVEAVPGKQVSLDGLRNLGPLGVVARSWSYSRLSCGERLLLSCDGNAGNSFRARRERILPLELGGGNGAPLDVGGTHALPIEWRRVCRGTS